ncbi:MAG: protein-L-isoaspartate(D-aspartate) O-methyltransferase [Candidatus Acidiferrales bacterium]
MSGKPNHSSEVEDKFEAARQEMVARQLRARGITSQRVLDAMASVPRHLFVSSEQSASAYADEPLPIGSGQTISQPFIVAAMSEALSLQGGERVLEVGAGSGYQAAILSLLARDVTAVEAQPALASQARERLSRLGYTNVRVEVGDGSMGWPPITSSAGPPVAPYEAILVAAAAPAVPPPLIEQLAEGGRLVIPVGKSDRQELLRIVKRDGATTQESLYACRFVPLLGHYGWHPVAQGSPRE